MDQRVDHKILQKQDDQQDNNGRQVDTAEGNGQTTPDLIEYRFGDIMDEPHDGIVGIGTDPRQDRPDNDEPHVDEQHGVNDFGQGHEKITQRCHSAEIFLTIIDGWL